jgi:beta-galactosidase
MLRPPVDRVAAAAPCQDATESTMPSFTIGDTDFLLDGQPFRVLSGALHYFRVHPDLWADRIHKARLMGLNTIETYVAWNAHARRPGEFDTDGQLDLRRFLELVAAEGMYAIVRPGPYICAEWDNGGLPGWLFTDPEVGVRRAETRFIAAVGNYFDRLLPIIRPLQIENGGPVILVQVENEYGAYGNDKEYLRVLTELTRSGGITVPLTTIDQPTDQMLSDGSLPGLHLTGSFGSRTKERLATLRAHQPTGPLMCAEFWDGWFDHWGAHHHTTAVEQSAEELDDLLAAGASVNIYMFHGGTNFGFTNGANDKGVYQPTTTSYDYDAPLSENGDPTAKFFAFRDVIARYAPVPDEIPAAAAPAPVFEAELGQSVSLWDAAPLLGDEVQSEHLQASDDLGHYSGFTLYRTPVGDGGVLAFTEVRDRAQVFLDRAPIGVMQRDHHERAITLPPTDGSSLELLVEDQGRVNYGPRIGEKKGLVGPAALAGRELLGWSVRPLVLERIDLVRDRLRAAPRSVGALSGPSFALAEFAVGTQTDLFLDTSRWGKGVAWINGFNLGRYWGRGPQHTLYIPAPAVRVGTNELIVFELHGLAKPVASFVAGLDLGHEDH